jgi:hypothetical protein
MAMTYSNARLVKIVLISLIAILISPTTVQAAGRTSTTVANTILSGTGVPSAKLGLNGDFYFDLKSMNFYGPKKNNRWPLPISLKGATGPVGPSGVDGKNGSTASTTAGTAGATGSTGPAGTAGSTGPAGSTGGVGAAGGIGLTGPAGATGPTGATGASGASVPVTISTGNIVFASLINGIPGTSSNSNAFGSFLAGKIYLVDVLIYATNLDAIPYPLKIAFTSSAGSPTISATYLVSYGSSYRTSSARPENSIIAKVLVNASSVDATSSLITTVTCGAQTGSSSQKLTVTGDFYIQEIGAIN